MGNVKVVKASAGSGKTYLLAYEYVSEVVRYPHNYKHILAVTFTNKATEEMKRRIVSEIDLLAEGRPSKYLKDIKCDTGFDDTKIRRQAAQARSNILHDYSRFAVLTIDKFFQRIIRSFIKELGIELDFSLELQTDSILAAAANQLIEEIPVREELRRWIVGFVGERIGEGRKWNVVDELSRLGGEIFREGFTAPDISRERLEQIVAQAATEADGAKEAMRVAAQQAMDLIGANGLTTADFAYGANSFARYFETTARGDIKPYGKRVTDALADVEKWFSKKSPRREDIIDIIPQLHPLLEQVCALYDTNEALLTSSGLLRENYRGFALLSDLLTKVDAMCSEQGIVPIAQTNTIIQKLVEGNDTPFIFERSGNHYSRFMIDEFQDTSLVQWLNFIPLLQNAVAQSEAAPVLLVGDVKQSIYRWRGGDWKILARQIRNSFAGLEEQTLATNWRSKRNVVQFNNNVIARCVEAGNKYLNDELSQALEAGVIDAGCSNELHGLLAEAYHQPHQDAADKSDEGHVTVTIYDKDQHEGGLPPVVERVEALQRQGYQPRDIALLVRTKREGRILVDMFMERKRQGGEGGCCYDVITQESLQIGFGAAADFAVAAMKLSVEPADPIARAVFNTRFGRLVEPLPEADAAFLREAGALSPVEAFESIAAHYGLGSDANDAAYLQALEQQIITFSTSTIADTTLFVRWWEEKGRNEAINLPEGANAITIITIHKSKGLEYRAVVIPFCDWQMTPSSKTIIWGDFAASPYPEIGRMPVKYRSALERSWLARDYFREKVYSQVDNLNIFYVAVTRAREELHLMMPKTAKPRTGFNYIDSLISAALVDMDGDVQETDGDTTVSFGQPCKPHAADAHTGMITPAFVAAPPAAKLRVKLQSERYFTEDGLSARREGVLLHKIFEQAATIEDIRAGIARLTADGTLTVSEAGDIAGKVDAALTDPIVSQWFGGSWREVRNESDIILPGSRSTRRPDRVMIAEDGRCVAVDYKFGDTTPAAHQKQMAEYLSILRQMGYRHVSGYVWYISLDRIVEVG